MPLINIPGPPVYTWTEEQRRKAGFKPGQVRPVVPEPKEGERWLTLDLIIGAIAGAPLIYTVVRMIFGGTP